MRPPAAERAASYLLEHARLASGPKAAQGPWDALSSSAFGVACSALGGDAPSLLLLARQRIRRVPQRAVRGLFTWAAGFEVELLESVPRADEVLALQATGRRCVSLLPEHVSAAPHANGLEFLIHDLCHLEKFSDPEHHLGQVGFFASLRALVHHPQFRSLEAELDASWVEDRKRLGADMNGSAVYLFVLLKMKLKMAARRRLARGLGLPAREAGPLDAREQAMFDELEAALYDCLELDDELRRAARATSARRDGREAALCVAREFERRGLEALSVARRAAARPALSSTPRAP